LHKFDVLGPVAERYGIGAWVRLGARRVAPRRFGLPASKLGATARSK